MELLSLRYFTVLAEELHYGRAAKRLHISQPPLSRHIMRLEDELGVKLFRRTSRRVELTPAGALFVSEAAAVLARAESAEERVRVLARGDAGSLAVGFNEPAIHTFLPDTVRDFRRRYPNVHVSLHELESGEQLRALREGLIHLGILRPFGHDLSGLQQQRLFTEHYVVALPEGHRLQKRDTVQLADLAPESFVMLPRRIQPHLFDAIAACCERAGFRPNIVQDAVTKQTTLALVAAGMGVALVPASSAAAPHRRVAFRPLDSDLPDIDIVALWCADTDSAFVPKFLSLIKPQHVPPHPHPPAPAGDATTAPRQVALRRDTPSARSKPTAPATPVRRAAPSRGTRPAALLPPCETDG
ncbi:MAG: hypothetical protein A3K19_04460 [Lentisphaerae bacterium RIFOXYB12_FULL_65_16]|nr:MAG: hypothetical protein A3K18_34930 [Lentisphaerae bacterium RIFOXYA12_64_32]OGV84573.1 MAG: hypothetical protein A3K19_04460 [Lentisphaerae bacterium RIFOXYB12_FULL_65_16]